MFPSHDQKDRELIDELRQEINQLKKMVEKIYTLVSFRDYYPQREKRPNPYEYPRYTNAKTTTSDYKKTRGENEVVFLKEADWYNPWGGIMPYITKDSREVLDYAILELAARINHGDGFAGKLNYAISKLFNYTLKDKGLNYANINEMIGALECIKLELYRRIASPYEDKKIELNGDVYDES